MKMLSVLLCGLVLGGTALAADSAPSVDDFLPPVQGGSTEVKSPDKVQTSGGTVTAASAQDAINTAVKKTSIDATQSVTPVRFPSGIGFVATGAGIYREMENPVATRKSRRTAYVQAYLSAKKELAQFLDKSSNSSLEQFREELDSISTDKQNLSNSSQKRDEQIHQSLKTLLAGYVIYQVQDDRAAHKVLVSIVTTTNVKKLTRLSPGVLQAEDLRGAFQDVLNEIKSGVIPPVGGRVIMVAGGKEGAAIGFGSCVISTSTNAAQQAKLNLDAQKIAALRARNALCGMISGDRLLWEGSMKESETSSIQEFEEVSRMQKDDPLKPTGETEIRKLDTAKQEFLSRTKQSDVYSNAIKGELPAGLMVKSWTSDDKAEVFAMAVYLPSMTTAAEEHARLMREGLEGGSSGSSGISTGTGFRDTTNPNVTRPGNEVKPGATGAVSNENDL